MIKVIDNVLDRDVLRDLQDEITNRSTWQSGWNMTLTDSPDWNWHQSLANDVKGMSSDSDNSSIIGNLTPSQKTLWDLVDRIIFDVTSVRHKLDRFYSNAHTYGQDGQIHTDDGHITALFYPMPWNIKHEGGTAFYNEDITDSIAYASYKENRLVIFDAKIPHRAMPVTRDCYELRSIVVYKTSMNTNDPSYMDWYYANR